MSLNSVRNDNSILNRSPPTSSSEPSDKASVKTTSIARGILDSVAVAYKMLFYSSQAAEGRPEIRLFDGGLPIPVDVVETLLSFIQDRPTLTSLSQISGNPGLSFLTYFNESHHYQLRCYKEESSNLRYFLNTKSDYKDRFFPNPDCQTTRIIAISPNSILNADDVLRYDTVTPSLNTQFATYTPTPHDGSSTYFKQSFIQEMLEAFEEADVSILRTDLNFTEIGDARDSQNVNAVGHIVFHGKIMMPESSSAPFLLVLAMSKESYRLFRGYSYYNIRWNSSCLIGWHDGKVGHRIECMPFSFLTSLIEGKTCSYPKGILPYDQIYEGANMQICRPSEVTDVSR